VLLHERVNLIPVDFMTAHGCISRELLEKGESARETRRDRGILGVIGEGI
jgi:hypothetical protein